MLSRLGRLWAQADGLLVLEAYLVLLFLDVSVRLVGLLPTWRLVRTRCRSPARTLPIEALAIAHLRQVVQRAARHEPYPMTCLPQSLALAWLLAGRGVLVELRFGVRSANGGVHAHAWLEWQGRPLEDGPDDQERFRPLASAARRARG